MKMLLLSLGIFVSAIGCWETEVITCFPIECGIPATVRYLGGYRLSPESSMAGKVVFIHCLTEISTPAL